MARAHSATDTPERSAAARISSHWSSGQRPICRTGLICLCFFGGLPTGFGVLAMPLVYRPTILSQYKKLWQIPISCIDTKLYADTMRADKEKPRCNLGGSHRGRDNWLSPIASR